MPAKMRELVEERTQQNERGREGKSEPSQAKSRRFHDSTQSKAKMRNRELHFYGGHLKKGREN